MAKEGDGIVRWNAEAQIARVQAGCKGGPWFKDPNVAPSMTFEDGWPKEVAEKMYDTGFEDGTPEDTWFTRRMNKNKEY